MKPHAPVWTVALISAAVATWLFPTAAATLVQERTVIDQGQWWRLLTGSLVHYSTSHLLWNCLVIGIAGGLLECSNRKAAVTCLVGSMMLIGPGLHLCLEQMNCYAGLSGIATAMVTCLILLNLGQGWIWSVALAALAAKLLTDQFVHGFGFASFHAADVRSVPSAHLLGALAGALSVVPHRRPSASKCREFLPVQADFSSAS
jgi:rhomboid family GlyGly-CTERM serine protease